MQANSGRFWGYVDKRGPDECWNWLRARDSQGYGRFRCGDGRTRLAHRVAWWLEYGEVPEAVCHDCDNPSCCNPKHLFGGTRLDNNRDMVAKGRYRGGQTVSGDKHHQAKLTLGLVREIRTRYAAGGVTQYQLATEYGVSQRTIAKAIHREFAEGSPWNDG